MPIKYGVFPNNINEIPPGEHWAIMTFSSITIPGDERSRTNPGHGYPERQELCIRYELFTNEELFKRSLEYKYQVLTSKYNIIGIHVTESFGPKIVTDIRVK